MTQAMSYFPAEVEVAELAKSAPFRKVQEYLARSGGRRACPHPNHRFAQVPNSPAELILPECAGRPAWLKARLEGVGGSEVGALIGVNEYETPASVWNKKKRADIEELTGAAIEWGHRLESVVAEKTAEEIGLVSRFAGGLWADREKPHLRVTPDRFACKPRSWKAQAVIECKTAGDDEYWESGTIRPGGQGDGSAPLAYQAQIQWQMGILGLPVGYLGCFHLGMERQFFTVEVHFDREWFAEMVAEADRYWVQNILGDEMPMHDYRHPKTEELLKTLNPKVILPSTQLPDEAEAWLIEYRDAKAEFEKADTRLTAAKNFFRFWTGDAGAAYLGEEKIVSYPEINAKKGTIDVTRLREEEPELAERFTVRSSHRRMTIRLPDRFKLPKGRPS